MHTNDTTNLSLDSLDSETLKELIKHGIIRTDVLELVDEMKVSKIKAIHTYTITKPNSSNKLYQTYVKNELGKRKKIKAKTEELLYKKLYNHYFESKTYTLKSLYQEWEDSRKAQNLSSATIRRNYFHFKKYYYDNPISDKSLSKLKHDEIEAFFYVHIDNGMTAKELQNMKLIFREIMKMAKSKGYIEHNTFKDVEVKTYGCIPPKNTRDSSKVYMPIEKEKLFRVLNSNIETAPEITDSLGIFLLFKLGLRLGELVALKESDIDFNTREIHIHRTEAMELDSTGKTIITVVNHTKKKSIHGDRWLPLDDYSLELIQRVIRVNEIYGYEDNGYLFLDADGRTTEREIDYQIRKACKRANIEVKSAHDIRRTVASEMHSNGVSLEIIKKFLGHSDLATTRSYIFDVNEKDERNRIILDSLNTMNGLNGDSKGLKVLTNKKSSKAS